MLEHGAYALLIDACYDREKFPTLEQAIDWCWASSKEEVESVEFVLKKFFVLDGEVYKQNRIQDELEEYQAICAANAINGKKGGRPKNKNPSESEGVKKETQPVNLESKENPSESEANPNQEPLTTNQEPSTSKNKFSEGDMATALHIAGKIDEIIPNAKKRNIKSWANEIRLMVERDDRSHLEIRKIFDWANNDSFWQSNILSPSKLRKQFDQLTLKSKEAASNGSKQSSYDGRGRTEKVSDELNRIAKEDIERNGYADSLGSAHI